MFQNMLPQQAALGGVVVCVCRQACTVHQLVFGWWEEGTAHMPAAALLLF